MRAALGLADLCAFGEVPFDSALAAVKAKLWGPTREKNDEVHDVLWKVSRRIAAARARKHGFGVERPRNHAKMKDGDLFHHVLENMQDAVNFYEDRKTLRSMLDLATPGQEALYAIWWTQAEIDNGGFHQYFYNSTGILSPEALEGYRLIGAGKFAELHVRATKLFKKGVPLESRERRKAVERLPKEPFDELSDEFYRLNRMKKSLDRLCADYIRAHVDEFFATVHKRGRRS
jgi:hypothetical protein